MIRLERLAIVIGGRIVHVPLRVVLPGTPGQRERIYLPAEVRAVAHRPSRFTFYRRKKAPFLGLRMRPF